MMRRESDYHRSAYVRMCQKRNNDRKELINKIKRVDLIIVYLCIRHLDAMAGTKVSYREGLMDAFSIMYGDDETKLLWEYLKYRSTRVKKYIEYKRRALWGG